MTIREFTIKNFKTIESVTLELERMNIFVGPNGSGKSSLLQGLQFAVSSLQSVESISKNPWKKGQRTATLGPTELMYVPVSNPYELGRYGHFKQEEGMSFAFVDGEGDTCSVEVKKGKNKNVSIKAEGEDLGRKLQEMDPLFSALAPGLAGIPSQEEYKSPGIVRKAAARGDSNAFLRNILYLLSYDGTGEGEDSPGLELLCERLDQVFPGTSIEVSFDEFSDDFITVKVETGETWVPLELCGTGLLQTIHILSYIGLYEPSILILDEPDSHLHPQNQRRLIRLLNELSEELDFQVLISTHSRQLIDEAIELEAALKWMSGGELQDVESDRVLYLSELGALDTLDRLGGTSYELIVITEDSNGDKFLEPIIQSSGWDPDQYQIVPCHGSANVAAIGVLINFIRERFPSVQIAVYRDRDYDDRELEKIKKMVEENGAKFFTSPGSDIESFFLQESHLSYIFGEDINASTILDRAFMRSSDKSEYKLMNSITDGRLFGDVWKKAGDTARFAKKKMSEDRFRWSRGKFVLGALVAEAQEGSGGIQMGKDQLFDILLSPSRYLSQESIAR